jgi:hypothetical protein
MDTALLIIDVQQALSCGDYKSSIPEVSSTASIACRGWHGAGRAGDRHPA